MTIIVYILELFCIMCYLSNIQVIESKVMSETETPYSPIGETTETPAKRGKGRPQTGRTTIMIRIPIALKPAVEELKIQYRKVRKGHYR